MLITRDILRDIFYKMYFYIPKASDKLPSYVTEYPKFWEKYGLDAVSAKIKYSDSDNELFDGKYFESANSVDVSVTWDNSKKKISTSESDLYRDFKETISEIYSNNPTLTREVNEYWKQHANELLFVISQRNRIENQSIKTEVQKSLSEFNDNALRFINELIQNADDCIYKEDVNRLTMLFDQEKRIIVITYPEEGFTYDDIIALSSINETNKMTDFDKATTTIGEKGRGFKSIFVYFKEVEIESGGYHFKYNVDEASMFQPIYMGTPSKDNGTKLILRLKDEIVLTSEEDNKRKIKAGMSELVKDVKEFYGAKNPRNLYRNNSIFFTRNFTELVMIFSGKTTSDIIKIVNTHRIEDVPGERKIWWEKPDDNDLHYCAGSMEYYSAENIKHKDVTYKNIKGLPQQYKLSLVGITKYLDYDQDIIAQRYGDVTSVQSALIKKAMPIIVFGVSGIETNGDIEKVEVSDFTGHMYTYLPTSLNISLPFIFQMPFDLEDNRSCPKSDSDWNHFLLDKVWNPDNSIIRDWYEYTASNKLVDSIYNYLPTSKNSVENNYKTLAFYIDDKYYFDPHGGSKYASYAKDQINKFNKENAEKARKLFENISIFENKDNDELVNIDQLRILDKTLSLFDLEGGNIYWNHYKKHELGKYRFVFDAEDENSGQVIAFQKYIQHSSILLLWKEVMGSTKVHDSISEEMKECGKNKNFELMEQFTRQFILSDTWLSAFKIKQIKELTNENIDTIRRFGAGLLYFRIIFIDGGTAWVRYDDRENTPPILWLVSDSEYKPHKIEKKNDKKNYYIRVAIIDKTKEIYRDSIVEELISDYVGSIDDILTCIEKWDDTRVSSVDKLQIAGAYYLSAKPDEAVGVNLHMRNMFNSVDDINELDVVKCPGLFEDDVEKCIEWEQVRFSSWYATSKKNEYQLNLKYVSEPIAEVINQSSENLIICNDKHISFWEAISGRLLSEEEKDIGLEKFKKTYTNCVVNPDYFKALPDRNFLKFPTTGYLILKSEEYLSDACDSETMMTTQFIQSVRERYSRVKANKYDTGSLGRNIGTIKAIQAYQIFSLIDNNNYREVVGKEGDVCNELLQNVNDFVTPGTNVAIEIENESDGDSWMTLVYEERMHVEVVKGSEEERHGFLPSDILSLISIGNSTKDKEGDNFTGNKGIGFKNVYKVFDQVYVDSNGFKFLLDDSFSVDPERLFEELNVQGVGNIYGDKACKVESILGKMDDVWDAVDEKGMRKRFPIIQVSKNEIDKSIYYRDSRKIGDGRNVADTLTAYKLRFRSDQKVNDLKNQLRGSYLQWLYSKNKELLEGFRLTDIDANDYNMLPLFLHNLESLSCYIDGTTKEYPIYPVCEENSSVDDGWIESDKFYSNRGLMTELNLLGVKSNRYENKKNTETDGIFAYVEVRFIKDPVLITKRNEKVTTKDGRLYITLPTEIDTGGAVHINIPALEAKANRREIFSYSFDKTNEGEWNQSIAEKVLGIGGIFEQLFNSFTARYTSEVANYAFLYVPRSIFRRFSEDFPLFQSCLEELEFIPCITAYGLKMRSLRYVKENAHVYKLDVCMRSWFELMDPTFERFYQQGKLDVEFVDIIDEKRWGLLDELNKRHDLRPPVNTYSYRDFFEYISKYWAGYYSQLSDADKKKCDKSFSNRISLITEKTSIKDHYSKWQQWKKIYKESMAGKSKNAYIGNLVKAICFDCFDFSSAFYFTAEDINTILDNNKLEIPNKIVSHYKKYLINKGYFDFMHYFDLLKREIISIDIPREESTALQISELYALAMYTGEANKNELVPIDVEGNDIITCAYTNFGVNSLEDLRSEIPILLMNNTFQESDEQEFFLELPKKLYEENSLELKQDSDYDILLKAWIDKGFVVSRANIAEADNIYELCQLDTELYDLLPTVTDSRIYLDLLRKNKITTDGIVNNILQYWLNKIEQGSNKADYFTLYIDALTAFTNINSGVSVDEPKVEYDIECLSSKKIVSTCNKLSSYRSGNIFQLNLDPDEEKYEPNPLLFWNEIDMSLTAEQRREVASFYYNDEMETDEDVNKGIERFLEHLYMCSDNVSLVPHYPSSQYLTVIVDGEKSFLLFKDYTESIIVLLREVFGFSLGSKTFKPFVNLYEYNSLLPIGTQEEYEIVRKNVFDILDSGKDENEINKLKMQLMSLQYQLPDNKLLCGYGMNCPFISSYDVIEQSSLQAFEYSVFGFHIAITLYGSKEAKDVLLKYASKMVVKVVKKKTKKKKEKGIEDFTVCNGKYSFDGRELVLRGADIEKEKLLVGSILDYLIGQLNDIRNNLIFDVEMVSDKGAKKKEALKLDLTHAHRAIMVYELNKAKEQFG